MRRIVEARLIPWEPGIPGIAVEYEGGKHFASDARFKSADVIEAANTFLKTIANS